MLSNAYFLSKFRFDTAENKPAKNLQNFANFANPNPNLKTLTRLRRTRSQGSARLARTQAQTLLAGLGVPADVPLPAEGGSAATAGLFTGCGKLYKARSRLYRNEILQVNMRLKALAEIYTMHSFALF